MHAEEHTHVTLFLKVTLDKKFLAGHSTGEIIDNQQQQKSVRRKKTFLPQNRSEQKNCKQKVK
jgi:hypothetical protein